MEIDYTTPAYYRRYDLLGEKPGLGKQPIPLTPSPFLITIGYMCEIFTETAGKETKPDAY